MGDAPPRGPAPIATGSLSATPLPHLLVYVRNRRLTGVLELVSHDGRDATIVFWRGRITDARTRPPVAYFGSVAYELGFIDAATHDATLREVADTKRLHGEILVARGALTPSQRDDALTEQTCRKVHHVFSFPAEATYEFYEAASGFTEPPIAFDPLVPIWRGIRDHRPERSIRDIVGRYGAVPLQMVNESPLHRVDLTPEERDLCDALTMRPMTIGQLRALTRVRPERVELLAYLMLIGKCVEPVAAPVTNAPEARPQPTSSSSIPVTQSGEMPRRPPSFRIPSAASMPAMRANPPSQPYMPTARPASIPTPSDLGAAGLATRAQTIEKDGYFEVLGVSEGASVESIRATYFNLAKSWHPDRLPADLAAFRAEVETIFSAMTRAYRTLTDPDSRRAYVAARAQGAGPRRERAEIVRDIEQAMQKHEFAVAEAEARKLHDANVEDAEALALMAWASAQAGDAPEEKLRAALAYLDRAVNSDRFCERAYFYRGVVYKKLGNVPAAIRDFSRVVQIEPKNVEAAREIRLHEMRQKKGSGEHALEALGSLLRGKKK